MTTGSAAGEWGGVKRSVPEEEVIVAVDARVWRDARWDWMPCLDGMHSLLLSFSFSRAFVATHVSRSSYSSQRWSNALRSPSWTTIKMDALHVKASLLSCLFKHASPAQHSHGSGECLVRLSEALSESDDRRVGREVLRFEVRRGAKVSRLEGEVSEGNSQATSGHSSLKEGRAREDAERTGEDLGPAG